jgi:7-cyano-7-deazaguanine synthase
MLTAHEDSRHDSAGSAVLCSGGLDSIVLVAALARESEVLPLYVSVGLGWEAAERDIMRRALETPAFATRVLPMVTLSFDMRDLYPQTHWAIAGTPPGYHTPDEDVYLTGRNAVLLTKGGICCAMRRIPKLALGVLAGNPFPDANSTFFTAMSEALSLGLAYALEIVAPFSRLTKADVIRLGRELGVDLSLTLSCMNPQGSIHCGRCSKCRERREAFVEAGVPDDTRYAAPAPRAT